MKPRTCQALSRQEVIGLSIAIALVGASWPTATASAQIAGSTILGQSMTELVQLSPGWSVKKALLGKTVYSDSGEKIGKVDDLIVAPDRRLSYVIVGAGGFLGMGRHDVAIPTVQLKDLGGRLVVSGVNKESLRAMPAFNYTDDDARYQAFVSGAEYDVASGKQRVAELQAKVGAVTADLKARTELELESMQQNLRDAESALGQLKRASVKRWKEFEAEVTVTTTRLRDAIARSMA